MHEEAGQVEKKRLRTYIRNLKQSYAPEQLAAFSNDILEKLENHPKFLAASRILFYHALPDEVQTQAFIEKWWKHKLILLPKVEGPSLTLHPYFGKPCMVRGAFGIEEPLTPRFMQYDEIELAIVPGMAFDWKGNRLGRGKGFYDRLFGTLPRDIYKIGLAFRFQIVEKIPATELDVPVNEILT